jgi:putative membrane protein
MKVTLVTAAAGMLLASSALAQVPQPVPPGSTNTTTSPPAAAAPGSATTGAVPGGAMSAADFVQKVAISDMFEIQSSQLALQKKADADSKPFAQKMMKDHKKTSNELKAMLKKGKIDAQVPTALDAEHQAKLDQMKNLSGAEFDKAYDQAQMEGHQKAVALFEAYAQGGDNPQLKQWAAKTLPHLKQHMSMAQKLKF